MKIIDVIPSRMWRHKSGRTASLYGSVPWVSEAEKADWTIETIGWTWSNDNGTVGLGRPPAGTREEALEIMRAYNARRAG